LNYKEINATILTARRWMRKKIMGERKTTMKKKTLLFTKVLFAVLMTIMVFGVNKQTAMADELTEEQLRDSILGYPHPDEVDGEYHIGVFNYDTLEYDWTCTFVHEHDYEEHYVSASTYDNSDGYYYYTCVGEEHRDGELYSRPNGSGICDAKEVKGDTIYAPKKIKLSKTTYYYTGKKIKPSVTVYDRKGNVIDSKYYTVSYENNKYAGKATVTVNFNEESCYNGTLTKAFDIKLKVPTISIKSGHSGNSKGNVAYFMKMKVKNPNGARGCIVEYSTNKNFKNAETEIYKLKKGTNTIRIYVPKKTTYYVRVRAYSITAKEGVEFTETKAETETEEPIDNSNMDFLYVIANWDSESFNIYRTDWSTVKKIKIK
jgi:hypothetical protein